MILSSGKAQQFDTTAYKAAYKAHFERLAFSDSLTTETKIAGLSSAWAEAKFNFANFDLIPTVNWDSIYTAYIPKVMASRDRKAYYILLKEFYTHLNDGHTLIVPPKELWNEFMAALPIGTKLIEDKVVITQLKSEKPEFQLLQPRTIIHKINGVPAKEYAEKQVAPYVSASTPHDLTARLYSYFLTHGSLKEPLLLELETPKGKKITHSFNRESRDQLFPASTGYTYKKLNKATGLLTINTFNDPEVVKFYDSLFQTAMPKNLIIDIRNNGGGNGNNGFELIGYLTNEPFPMSMQVMRRYKPVQRAWGGEPDVLENWKLLLESLQESCFYRTGDRARRPGYLFGCRGFPVFIQAYYKRYGDRRNDRWQYRAAVNVSASVWWDGNRLCQKRRPSRRNRICRRGYYSGRGSETYLKSHPCRQG